MSEQEIIQVLNESAQQGIPDTLDLWPVIKARVQPRFLTTHGSRALPFARLAWGLIGIVLFLLLALALSPDFRAAAAQSLQRILAGVSERSDGSIQFDPSPPFAVKQPRNLPRDFKLTVSQYVPSTGIVLNSEAKRLPDWPDGASPIAQQALKRDWGSAAHLVFVYETPQSLYLLISERKPLPNESLPVGEKRTMANQNASLLKIEGGLQLIWIDEGTWIAIETNIPEEEMLRIAASFVTTQSAASADEQPVPSAPNASAPSSKMPFCDPGQQPPKGLLLGSISGQARKGNVWIELLDRSMFPETVAYGTDVPDRREVLADALAALRDSSRPMQKLPYSSISSFRKDDGEDCLQPNPQVQGFIVIEVWQDQVSIGYGGAGAEMKARAILALEKQIQELQ